MSRGEGTLSVAAREKSALEEMKTIGVIVNPRNMIASPRDRPIPTKDVLQVILEHQGCQQTHAHQQNEIPPLARWHPAPSQQEKGREPSHDLRPVDKQTPSAHFPISRIANPREPAVEQYDQTLAQRMQFEELTERSIQEVIAQHDANKDHRPDSKKGFVIQH